MNTSEIIHEYRATKDEYVFKPDIFDEDPEKVRTIKRIITQRLSQTDRTLIVLYADCQSYRKLGKVLGVSHMTARKEVLRIRAAVLAEYEKETAK